MKTLLLMRHAKASSSNASVSDSDRPLVDEGRMAAERIGQFFKDKKISVDAALSSPALRARETSETFLQSAGTPLKVVCDERIYDGGPLRLLEVISELDEDLSCVLLVGHNPTLEELLLIVSGGDDHMSPGTLAKVDLESSSWSDAVTGKGTLDWIVRPKELT